MKEIIKIRLVLLVGVLFVTSSSFIIRFASQQPYALAFARVLATGLISYFVLNKEKHLDFSQFTLRDWGLILLAGASLATHFGWWFESLEYIPIGISLSLTNSAPVWMALFSLAFLGVRLKRRQVFAIAFVILGSALLFLNSNYGEINDTRGVMLALGSAIGFAIYLLVAKSMVPKLGLWRYFGLVNLSTALVLLPWIAINGQISEVPTYELWIFGMLLAIFPGILGHAVYNWSMPKLDSVDVGVATLGEPILGTVIAWIFLSESLTELEMLGFILLITALIFSMQFKGDEEPAMISE